jgi:hypothetical protein
MQDTTSEEFMIKRLVIQLTTGCCLLAMTDILKANHVTELSLERKVSQSHAVFIGRVVSVQTDGGHLEPGVQEYSSVVIQNALKGRVSGTVRIVSKGPIAEWDPVCCDIGENYLFFVTKTKSNFYVSVNGPYGIYKLPKE